MPAPQHNRITMSGFFGTSTAPVEIWSWSLNAEFGGLSDTAAKTAAATTLAGNWLTRFGALQRGSTVLTRVRIASVGADGLVRTNTSGAYEQGDWNGQNAGTGAGGVEMPLQTACCVSLLTARAGATGKGRFFLPQLAKSLDGAFLYQAGDCTLVATAARGFITDVNAVLSAGGTPLKVVVASSKGYLTPVTQVKVGRVPDTMRSRRNAMAESYVLSAAI
jgi:hypothetical protein